MYILACFGPLGHSQRHDNKGKLALHLFADLKIWFTDYKLQIFFIKSHFLKVFTVQT
jgi:hypothetical protein